MTSAVPTHAWRRWLHRAFELLERRPLLVLGAVFSSLLWIFGSALLGPTSEIGRYVILAMGAHWSFRAGFVMANGFDVSADPSIIAKLILSPHRLVRSLMALAPVVVVAGCAGALVSGALPEVRVFADAPLLPDKPWALFEHPGDLFRQLVFVVQGSLLPFVVVTGTYALAALSPPALLVHGASAFRRQGWRGWGHGIEAICANREALGVAAWFLLPMCLLAALIVAASSPAGLVAIGAAFLFLQLFAGALAYIAHRELVDGIWTNSPAGLGGTKTVIDQSRADPPRS